MLELNNYTLWRIIVPCIGMFFLSSVLGNATGFRNVMLVILVLLSFVIMSWRVLCDKRLRYFLLLVFGFLLVNVPSAYFSNNFSALVNLLKEYVIAILLMTLGIVCARDSERWRKVIRWQIVAVTLLAILSLGIAWIQANPSMDTRLFSHWYPWYGISTTVAVMLLPLCFLFFDKDDWQVSSAELVFLGSCLLIVLACAQNRASFIVILCLVIFFCLKYFDSFKTKVSLLALSLIVSLTGFVYQASQRLPPENSGSFSTENLSFDVMRQTFSNDSRIAGWSFWIDKGVEQMPWYGFGIEKRSMVRLLTDAEKEDPRVAETGLVSHAHNTLLNVWLRSGYAGLLMFLLMWGFAYKKLGEEGAEHRLTSLVGRAVLLSLLLKNQTDDFFEPPIIYMAFLWLGLVWGRSYGEEIFCTEPKKVNSLPII